MRRALLPLLLLCLAVPAAEAPARSTRTKTVCKTRTTRTSTGRRRTVRRCRRVPVRPARPARPVTPATPAAPAAPAPGGERAGIRDCVNTERAKAGLGALADDPALDRAAQAHAEDMRARGYFAHETPEGRTPWDRIRAALQGEDPFDAMGENIAMGYRDAAAACTAWMNSSGHRHNILDPQFTHIGTGWTTGGYAVQDFGGRA